MRAVAIALLGYAAFNVLYAPLWFEAYKALNAFNSAMGN